MEAPQRCSIAAQSTVMNERITSMYLNDLHLAEETHVAYQQHNSRCTAEDRRHQGHESGRRVEATIPMEAKEEHRNVRVRIEQRVFKM